jgi:hypothetical protein
VVEVEGGGLTACGASFVSGIVDGTEGAAWLSTPRKISAVAKTNKAAKMKGAHGLAGRESADFGGMAMRENKELY